MIKYNSTIRLIPLTILLLAAFSFNGKSQQVSVKVSEIGKAKTSLTIAWPYKGYNTYLNMLSKSYKIDSLKEHVFKLNSKEGGIFNFEMSDYRFSLILFPEDTIRIEARIDSNFTYDIKGSNAKGHLLWLQASFPTYIIYPKLDSILGAKPSLQERYAAACRLTDSLDLKLDTLYETGKINIRFRNTLAKKYKSVIYEEFITFNQIRRSIPWDKIEPYARQLLNQSDIKDTSGYAFISDILFEFASSTYHGDTSRTLVSKKLLPHDFQAAIPIPVQNHAREYQLATSIYFYASRGYEKTGWKTAYEYYKRQYPKTELKQAMDSILKPYYLNKKDVVNKIFIEKERNSLSELLTDFSGSYVFIDLWATWCGPCRTEMMQDRLNPLTRLLDSVGIKKLYLSIDDQKSHEAWKSTADALKLSGYHHRVSTSLYNDIQQKIYGKETFIIPRYVLIGKNGTVLDPNLPRPSSLDALKQKLLEHVRKSYTNE